MESSQMPLLFMPLLFLLLISVGLWFASMNNLIEARYQRRRARIEIDYVRRGKQSEKKLKQIADEAWEKLQAEAKALDERQHSRHEKFWSEFAAAYGKATGQTFPRPPPEIFVSKIPPKGSA